MRKSKSGFTLIELLVVVVIIGILATITVIAYRGIQERARDDRRKTDVANIAKAMELYYSDNGRYPAVNGATTITPATWASSIDSSWTSFSSTLRSADAIKSTPVDPRNVPNTGATNTGVMYGASNYSYAVYVNTGNYCGSAVGQMYIIVYRLEQMRKETFSDGDCSTYELGTGYYNGGASYYRVAR